MPTQWRKIYILVNNAGSGVTDKLMQNANVDDWDVIIDTNVKGLLYVTNFVLDSMVQFNSGHIINIGSSAVDGYYKGGNVYCTSKHAVKALTNSLRIDLSGSKIRVTQVHPGAVQTEFHSVRWGGE